MPNALIHHQPKDGLQAKFSMEFCMASLLLYGKAGLNEFADEVVNRPAVQEMIRRILRGEFRRRSRGLQQDDDDSRHPTQGRTNGFRARRFREGESGPSHVL